MPGLRNGSWVALLAICASEVHRYAGANPDLPRRWSSKQAAALSTGPNGRVTIKINTATSALWDGTAMRYWWRRGEALEAIRGGWMMPASWWNRWMGTLSDSCAHRYAGPDTPAYAPKVEYCAFWCRAYANLEDVKLGNGGAVPVISGVAGTVKASSVNGSIKAEKLEGRADLSTINGLLEADFDRVGASHPITLSSVNGPIKLLLPGGTRAEFERRAQREGGGIDTGIRPPSAGERCARKRLSVVHAGGPQIRLTNVNGGISIHSAWSRRPTT